MYGVLENEHDLREIQTSAGKPGVSTLQLKSATPALRGELDRRSKTRDTSGTAGC
jgi:hypothetical protein